MATAVETFTWDPHEAALKLWLGITGTAEDTHLTLWLAAAAKDCDDFCGWKFTNLDGDEVDATPTDPSANPLITLGIYEWVAAARAMKTSEASKGIQAARTGPISTQYAGGVSGMNAAVLARRVTAPFWAGSVYNPLLMGKE